MTTLQAAPQRNRIHQVKILADIKWPPGSGLVKDTIARAADNDAGSSGYLWVYHPADSGMTLLAPWEWEWVN